MYVCGGILLRIYFYTQTFEFDCRYRGILNNKDVLPHIIQRSLTFFYRKYSITFLSINLTLLLYDRVTKKSTLNQIGKPVRSLNC